MADPEDQHSPAPAIPSWQRDGAGTSNTSGSSDGDDDGRAPPSDAQPEDQLQVARRFLEADEVKTASRDKKVEFLKSKGVEDGDIQKLLGESPSSQDRDSDSSTAALGSEHTQQETTQTPPSLLPAAGDRPPIVTYPEFLTKPQRPPPLVTTGGLLNTLYTFAGLSTLLYGTSKYVVSPMVENLTDARADLYETSSKKLDALVAKLEKTVSVIPPPKSAADASPGPTDDEEGDASDAEDPTEMFHRDVGTQTTPLPASPGASAKAKAKESEAEPTPTRQADRLKTLAKTLSGIKDQFRTQSEDMDEIRTLLDVFRDDLDGMTYGSPTQFVGGYDMYGAAKKSEPEDEIRKVRDNIRRVKGVLLSTRNFPGSTRGGTAVS
ncbi:sphinganine-1-phosphate aldolase BST1 [Purpureocillium lavendulum]|uniref:Peroxisomal membrane protein PEX14 n=1 Tax=Purpureocillium lavendulum TaxID=1247861 RepID=A0AB34FNU4_9HYPO|nr:sphinganine-1-phosphate aldolase BST1 [Purpureocillium lavendulum]